MPRTPLPLTHDIDYLSILDQHGNLDSQLEPEISEKKLFELYRSMILGRKFDERMLDLQRQGRIGTFPPTKGQEAAQIGCVSVLEKKDWFAPSFRETPAEIHRGRSLESILLYYNGYNEGARIDPKQRDLPMSIPVASQVLHAVGLGMAAKYRKMNEIVMSIFGDGATSEGDFHEALNCASVFQSPVIFVCQNNQWAISLPVSRQMHSKTIAQKAAAYDMPGIQVDGNDILAVYSAAREAADRARRGEGPTFIECVTYRIMMHTTADDPSRYRQDGEVEKWREKDPIQRFSRYLQEKNILTEEKNKSLEDEILQEIQLSVENAEKMMKNIANPLKMFDHLYGELPPYVKKQKKELEDLLTARTEDNHG
jgi:pyruvate dehydrogenase E1 component alpha subunit